VEASHCFTQLAAAWRTPPFPCNAHLTPFCGFRYSPKVVGLSCCVFFFLPFLSRPAARPSGWGGAQRDVLDRHFSAGPRRWRPASGPVVGADLAVCPPAASVIYITLWLTTTPLWLLSGNNSKSFHQIICSLSTAVAVGGTATPGASGSG
jgi:hypothetical protein